MMERKQATAVSFIPAGTTLFNDGKDVARRAAQKVAPLKNPDFLALPIPMHNSSPDATAMRQPLHRLIAVSIHGGLHDYFFHLAPVISPVGFYTD